LDRDQWRRHKDYRKKMTGPLNGYYPGQPSEHQKELPGYCAQRRADRR
jgi:hypothetical protein